MCFYQIKCLMLVFNIFFCVESNEILFLWNNNKNHSNNNHIDSVWHETVISNWFLLCNKWCTCLMFYHEYTTNSQWGEICIRTQRCQVFLLICQIYISWYVLYTKYDNFMTTWIRSTFKYSFDITINTGFLSYISYLY